MFGRAIEKLKESTKRTPKSGTNETPSRRAVGNSPLKQQQEPGGEIPRSLSCW